MEQITSRQNPLIARLRKLGGDRSLRRREGVFLCEGVKLAEEAVRWGAEIEVLVNNRKIDNGSAATWQTGSNTVKVNVTAADGTAKKTYTVTVTKS